jgi:hypothetical protein
MYCEIQVKGHLHQRWSAWLCDFELTHLSNGTTAMNGKLRDEAAVFGLLVKLRDMGVALISVKVSEAKQQNSQEVSQN